jgi:hypothetical protein
LKSNSNVFNISMHATSNNNNNNNTKSIDNTIIRLETIKNNNNDDFSVEKVEVSMLVKDQQTHLVHKLAGDWTK